MLNANETVERCALPFYTFLRTAAPATERRKAFRGLCVSSVSHTRARSPARSLNESSQMVGRERDETKVIITMIIISENRVYETTRVHIVADVVVGCCHSCLCSPQVFV